MPEAELNINIFGNYGDEYLNFYGENENKLLKLVDIHIDSINDTLNNPIKYSPKLFCSDKSLCLGKNIIDNITLNNIDSSDKKDLVFKPPYENTFWLFEEKYGKEINDIVACYTHEFYQFNKLIVSFIPLAKKENKYNSFNFSFFIVVSKIGMFFVWITDDNHLADETKNGIEDIIRAVFGCYISANNYISYTTILYNKKESEQKSKLKKYSRKSKDTFIRIQDLKLVNKYEKMSKTKVSEVSPHNRRGHLHSFWIKNENIDSKDVYEIVERNETKSKCKIWVKATKVKGGTRTFKDYKL